MTLLFVVASCGGGDPTEVGQTASKVGGFGIVVEVPTGWSSFNSDEYGLQIAKRSTDLGTHEAPDGLRLTVTPGNTVLPDPEAMIDALAGPVEETSELIEPPQTVLVGGNQGVSVALAETIGGSVVVSRYIVVSAGGTDVLRFLLEAPEGQWEAGVPEFETILRNVVFEGGSDETPSSTQGTTTTSRAVATTETLPAVGGTGSASDPFQIPYHETFGPPVDSNWDHLIDQYGVWKWEVVDDELVATGQDVQVEMVPRAAWLPVFEFPDLPASAATIEVAQPTDRAACGLILGVDDGDLVVGVFVDAINQRFLTWAPVNLADLQDGLPWIADDRIRKGAPNEIRVLLDVPLPGGEQLLLYINDEDFGNVAGWSEELGDVASIGPAVLFEASTDVSECRFDNFSVTR